MPMEMDANSNGNNQIFIAPYASYRGAEMNIISRLHTRVCVCACRVLVRRLQITLSVHCWMLFCWITSATLPQRVSLKY